MRDIMEMAYEAHQNSVSVEQELFTKMLFTEINNMKSVDIAPYLSCDFDILRHEYRVTLKFPAGFNKSVGEKR